MKTILVPTDFSEPSQWAIEVAADIAARAGAVIILLHIVEEPTPQSFNVSGEWELNQNWEEKIFTLQLIRKSKMDLLSIASYWKEKGVVMKTELRIGNTYHAISSIIAEHTTDLVVMGTYGHSRLEEILLGSNTEKVIRRSRCPVITVHQKPSQQIFKSIVYATSLNEAEREFSQVIRIAQELYDSTIHVVRVNTRSNFSADRLVKKSMEKFVNDLQLKNYTLNIFNDHTEEEGILHFAESVKADLIGMATHGRSGFVHVLTGSLSEDVIHHSPRPVLTYLTK